MNARRLSRLVGVASVAIASVGASNCADQREPECTVAPAAAFATRLELQPGSESGDCTAAEGDSFTARIKTPLTAGVFGLRPYLTLGSDNYPDYEVPQDVAIQFIDMANIQATTEARAEGYVPNDPPIYAYGRFTTPTPQGDICSIPTLTAGHLIAPALEEIPAVPPDPEDPEDEGKAAVPARPAVDALMEVSDMRVLVTAGYPGTQFEATIRYTINGCSRVYLATGVFGGSVGFGGEACEGEEEGPDGKAAPSGLPDQSLCDDAGHTGINPDFPTVCDPDALICLLDGPFGTGAR